MPLVPCSMNIAWELNAIIVSKGAWGHVGWFVLDVFIFAYNVRFLDTLIQRFVYCISTITIFFFLWWFFRVQMIDGMLISVFGIDLIMALVFIIQSKVISSHGKTCIALTKLLGDLFAFLGDMNKNVFVLLIGIVVLLSNLYYLCQCFEEKTELQKKRNRTY